MATRLERLLCPTDEFIRDFAWKVWARGVYPSHLNCEARGLKCGLTKFHAVITAEWRVENGLPARGDRWTARDREGYLVTAEQIKSTGTSAGKGPKVKESQLHHPPGSLMELREEYWKKWHRRRLGLCVPWEGSMVTL